MRTHNRSVGVGNLCDVSAPRLLVIQHEDACTVGWFGDWFADAGLDYDVVLAHRGDAVPADPRGYDGLVVLGGAMGAHDDAMHPWLPPTKALIARTVEAGTCFLGICLGHQLAAVALGGEVIVNPLGSATGLTPVGLTAAGRGDELTGVIADRAPSVQWNDDIVSRLPDGAVELATAPDGSVQAARFGPRAWGVQFHPEASPAMVGGWIAATPPSASGGRDFAAVVAGLHAAQSQLRRDWGVLARRWTELVATSIPVP